MKDATGKDINLNHRYGYTQSNNGITDIIHCVAEKFNDESVTVRPYKRFRGCYSGEPNLVDGPYRATAVKPFILFPILP